MFLLDLFRGHNTCTHDGVSPNEKFSYCPTCGELVENEWFITRCACCGIKQRAIIKNGEIIPETNFCHNCGSNEYVVEKLDRINFIDINYAVLIKSIVPEERFDEVTQCWEEKPAYTPKLLQLYQ